MLRPYRDALTAEACLVTVDDQDEPPHLSPARAGHRHSRIDRLVGLAHGLTIAGIRGRNPCREDRSQRLEGRLGPGCDLGSREAQLSLIHLTDQLAAVVHPPDPVAFIPAA